jgi:hypothetical protein
MLVSVTRLQLRFFRFLPQFFWINRKTIQQIVKAPGFRQGLLRLGGPRVFWTVTVWKDEGSMRQYRGSGAHGQAMKLLAGWCDEASVVHWTQDTETLPDWDTMHTRMQEQGRRSKVNHPSASQRGEPWIVPRPRWRIEQSLSAQA